jgi:hypothetical protein
MGTPLLRAVPESTKEYNDASSRLLPAQVWKKHYLGRKICPDSSYCEYESLPFPMFISLKERNANARSEDGEILDCWSSGHVDSNSTWRVVYVRIFLRRLVDTNLEPCHTSAIKLFTDLLTCIQNQSWIEEGLRTYYIRTKDEVTFSVTSSRSLHDLLRRRMTSVLGIYWQWNWTEPINYSYQSRLTDGLMIHTRVYNSVSQTNWFLLFATVTMEPRSTW